MRVLILPLLKEENDHFTALWVFPWEDLMGEGFDTFPKGSLGITSGSFFHDHLPSSWLGKIGWNLIY